MTSRKVIEGILAVLGALFIFMNQQFELGLDTAVIVSAVATAILYVVFEAKADIKRILNQIGEQSAKFKDPKFWLAAVSAILAALNEAFALGIPVEAVIAVLGIIMTVLFGAELQKTENT